MWVARVGLSLFLMSAAVCTVTQAQKIDGAFVAGTSFTSNSQITVSNPCDLIAIGACPNPVGTFVGPVPPGHNLFLEGSVAVRLLDAKVGTVALEVPVAGMLADIGPPQVLSQSGGGLLGGGLVKHMHSLYVTPGIRLKFLPGAPISPFASVGGGWAHYSLASSTTNGGALAFGGGVDFKTGIPLLGFRAEVRDFLTGEPSFTLKDTFVTGFATATSPNTQGVFHRNNVLVGGGVVLKF